MSTASVDDPARYRPNPSVLTALKSPRMLTREDVARDVDRLDRRR